VSATKVMVGAMLAAVLGRWANNKKAIPDAKGIVEVLFALALVAFLDQGKSEPVAKGMAWLFAAAVLLGNDSPITGLARVQASSSSGQVGAAAGAAAAAAGTASRTTGGSGGRTVAR
jgi:hypothetical protein